MVFPYKRGWGQRRARVLAETSLAAASPFVVRTDDDHTQLGTTGTKADRKLGRQQKLVLLYCRRGRLTRS